MKRPSMQELLDQMSRETRLELLAMLELGLARLEEDARRTKHAPLARFKRWEKFVQENKARHGASYGKKKSSSPKVSSS